MLDDSDPEGPPPGLAVAILVLGLVALCVSPLLIGFPVGLLAVVLAIGYRRTGPHRTMALWGLVLGLLGALASVGAGASYSWLYQRYLKAQGLNGGIDLETENAAPPWTGSVAPPLTLVALDGQKLDLAALKGRPVVLNFWATWCHACVEELPGLIRLAKEDVVVIGVSDEPEGTIEPFAKKHQIPYPLVSARAFPPPFNDLRAIPTTVFIDRKGVIRESYVGFEDYSALKVRALGPVFPGSPRPADPPAAVVSAGPLKPVERWSLKVEGALSLAACPDATEVFVSDQSGFLRTIDGTGRQTTSLSLPGALRIECGKSVSDGSVRFLAFAKDGEEALVLNASGHSLFSYRPRDKVEGGLWEDLDADGSPEMVLGLGRGLQVVSADGRLVWSAPQLSHTGRPTVISPARHESPQVAAVSQGSIVLFDNEGDSTSSLKPLDETYTQVDGARVDEHALLVGMGKTHVVAFDSQGSVQWQAPVREPPQGTPRLLAHGDWDADGNPEWVFLEKPGSLAIFSGKGEAIAHLGVTSPSGAALMKTEKETLLVLLDGSDVKAFALVPLRSSVGQ
jgi:peroxiredoxin